MGKLPFEIQAGLRSIIIAAMLSILYAITVYFTGLKETTFTSAGTIILIISIFSGGYFVSKSYQSKGLVRGISLGIVFFTLLLVLTLIFSASPLNMKGFFYTLALCITAGGVGGILGISLSGN
ncbi:MAG: TIGR04086 family membrane protein [Bacillota bacterium]|nr:TIGR04086 family membrane protein [Bacillota bacterium]